MLFLCTHNSARSQMAEGLLRYLAGDRFEAMSAGTEATNIRPLAVRAMDELGIDISGQESKTLDRYLGESFDYVITVCANRCIWSKAGFLKVSGHLPGLLHGCCTQSALTRLEPAYF